MNQSELLANLLRNDLGQYCIAQAPTAACESFEFGAHHKHIIETLQRVERGELPRVMVFMPPQHGKSTLISKLFPAWYMGRHPTHSVISASYGQEFAAGIGRVVRNLASSQIHTAVFPEAVMSDDSSAQHHFSTAAGGEYYAVGRGSPITGRGGNIIIIDDPLKDRREASSTAIREQLKEWYTSVILTRQKNSNASLIIVQTRWHVDDLAGWILREHKHEQWHVIEFPALADERDILGRHPGDALWPSHFPVEFLERQRRSMSTNEWLSLYQQRPTIGSGYLFRREWLEERLYDPSKHAPAWRAMNRAILVDPANSEKEGSDYTQMWVVGASEDQQFYVLDIVRDHFTLVERGNKLFELHKKWGQPTIVAYEQYGMQADIAYLQDKMDRESYHFSIIPVGGAVSKPDRIERLEPIFREGRMWFPVELMYKGKDGIREDLVKTFLEEEFVNYVQGGGGVKHDDGLDALARLFDVSLRFPTSSVLGFAVRRFQEARAAKRSGLSPWSA